MKEKEFVEQVGRWRKIVKSLCQRHAIDEMTTDDISQDVLLKLWNMRDEIDTYHSVEALVKVMCRRMIIDVYRVPITVDVDDAGDLVTEQSSPSQQMEYYEFEQWVKEKMKALPSTQYSVLYLRQVEGRENKEIANLLGITSDSVSTLLARARKQLLQDIKKKGI